MFICTHVREVRDQGDLFPGLGKAVKLAVCRRGKPWAWSACLGPQPGLALQQVIEFNRMRLRTIYTVVVIGSLLFYTTGQNP